MNFRTAYDNAVRKLLSQQLSKTVRIRIYKAIILSSVLYGCKTRSLTLRGVLKL